jgi:hypothetical protein
MLKIETYWLSFDNLTKMEQGYIYCFSNESMPGILKIGMTKLSPDARLAYANLPNTWKPPTPYKIIFAKKVNNYKQKEITLHLILAKYAKRIHPRREFFCVSHEEVKTFFDLIDGDEWINENPEPELKAIKRRKQRTRKPVVENSAPLGIPI